jgi:hypothetical protein
MIWPRQVASAKPLQRQCDLDACRSDVQASSPSSSNPRDRGASFLVVGIFAEPRREDLFEAIGESV